METLEFATGLHLGVEKIDRQHGHFFELMNKLIAADTGTEDRKLVGEIIGELAAYVVDHFELEEELMARFGYEGLAEHQLLHVRFAARVESFHRKFQAGEIGLDNEVMGHLVSWFTEHIRGEDMKYVELFKENGE